nr:MAG TPA: hypothetical protein [Caudoviricetes sp.]
MVKRFIFAYKAPFCPHGYTYRRYHRNGVSAGRCLYLTLSATIAVSYSQL